MNNHQADVLIESGRPLKELTPLFPSRILACEYFARSMSLRFNSPESCCVLCRQNCDLPPVAFIWRANLHNAKTILLSFLLTAVGIFASFVYSRWVVVEFTTFHRLCTSCQLRLRFRSTYIGVLQKALFAVLMLLLFLTVPVVIFFFVAIFGAPEGMRKTLAGGIIGMGFLVLVGWGFEACRKAMIPPSLRLIGRFPFFLRGIRKAA
jgi:hypothetical protein